MSERDQVRQAITAGRTIKLRREALGDATLVIGQANNINGRNVSVCYLDHPEVNGPLLLDWAPLGVQNW